MVKQSLDIRPGHYIKNRMHISLPALEIMNHHVLITSQNPSRAVVPFPIFLRAKDNNIHYPPMLNQERENMSIIALVKISILHRALS